MAPIRRFTDYLFVMTALIGLALAGAAKIARAQATQPAAEDGDVADAVDTLDLTGLQGKFQAVADNVASSVVSISAVDETQDSILPSAEMNPDRLQEILDQNTRTVGTGFIVGADGWICTNEHVIGQARQLWVTTSDRKVWPALVVGSDPRADLAVLKIPAGHLSPVAFGDPASLRRGQWSIALGNPYGLAVDGQSCMSVGVISALDRSLTRLAAKEDRLYSHLIETTAQINPGNSGGPLFDIQGKVIGINTAVILPQKTTNGIGFAIPATKSFIAEIDQLEQGKAVVYGYLGVTVAEPMLRQRQDAAVADGIGVRVTSTEPESPASPLLHPDDVLTSFNGAPIHDTDQFVRLVGESSVGKSTPVILSRAGKTLALNITPQTRPSELTAVTHRNQRLKWRGMLLGPAAPSQPGVAVIACDEDCPFKDQGVADGAVIQTVAGRPVRSLVELLALINEVPREKCGVGIAPLTEAAHASSTQPAP